MRKRLATLDVFSGCGGLSHGLHEAGVAESRMDQNVAGGSPLQCGGRAKGGRQRREGGRQRIRRVTTRAPRTLKERDSLDTSLGRGYIPSGTIRATV